jgi:hypothetical protein
MEATAHPLDAFFFVPLDGVRFLGFECVIGLFSSLMISLASIFYLLFSPMCFVCDPVMSTWLMLIAFLRLCDLPVKVAVLCRIYYLSKRIQHEDPRFMVRRLMEMVRSRLFAVQGFINYASYVVLLLGVFRIQVDSECKDSQFYQFCFSVILTFAVRLGIGVANYKVEERKLVNRGIPEFVQFFKHGATLYDIENLEQVVVNKEKMPNLREICAVCTSEFRDGEIAKLLPCSEFHNYHKECIDRWLIRKDACPLCGLSIKKIKQE